MTSGARASFRKYTVFRLSLPGELVVCSTRGQGRVECLHVSAGTQLGTTMRHEQQAAWAHACEALAIVERIAKPGVRCRDIYEEVRHWLATANVGSWSSHLGHGIGLAVHEGPHLNPSWDDVLEEGEVIAVEPALYDPLLRSGLRIENDYLVTAAGLVNLSPFPLGLAD